MTIRTHATIQDLYSVPDNRKAEIVNGELVIMSPTGGLPSLVASEIFVSLREYARRTKRGLAINDNAGFRVHLPNRDSFSPDAAYFVGRNPGMRFFEGAPIFAVEVRSEGDYGLEAERAIATKRTDYFAAGTLVVWDVDLLGDHPIRSYQASSPNTPTIFHEGDMAHAEPAVPGWRFSVSDLFAEFEESEDDAHE